MLSCRLPAPCGLRSWAEPSRTGSHGCSAQTCPALPSPAQKRQVPPAYGSGGWGACAWPVAEPWASPSEPALTLTLAWSPGPCPAPLPPGPLSEVAEGAICCLASRTRPNSGRAQRTEIPRPPPESTAARPVPADQPFIRASSVVDLINSASLRKTEVLRLWLLPGPRGRGTQAGVLGGAGARWPSGPSAWRRQAQGGACGLARGRLTGRHPAGSLLCGWAAPEGGPAAQRSGGTAHPASESPRPSLAGRDTVSPRLRGTVNSQTGRSAGVRGPLGHVRAPDS